MSENQRSSRSRLALALAAYGVFVLGVIIAASLSRYFTGAAYPCALILAGPVQLLTPYFEYPQAWLDPMAHLANAIAVALWLVCVMSSEKRIRVTAASILLLYWLCTGFYFYRMIAYGSA